MLAMKLTNQRIAFKSVTAAQATAYWPGYYFFFS